MTRSKRSPREIAARALCTMQGIPENIVRDGKPMWQSYLPEVDTVLNALATCEEGVHIVEPNTRKIPGIRTLTVQITQPAKPV